MEAAAVRLDQPLPTGITNLAPKLPRDQAARDQLHL